MKYEILKNKIYAIPERVLYNISRLLDIDLKYIYYNISLLTNEEYTDFEKIQVATNIMKILKDGNINHYLYDNGYSMDHIDFILCDLDKCYNDLFK